MSDRGVLRIEVSHPPGWMQLPLLGSGVHQGRGLNAWATSMAQQILAKNRGRPVRQMARDLARLTTDCRTRRVQLGYVFYPIGIGRRLAQLDFEVFAPDPENPVITLDLLESIYGCVDEDPCGAATSSRVNLPCGPAVRIRAARAQEARLGHATLTEHVTYAIRPAGFTHAIVATMTWETLSLGDKLAEMADGIARTIVITQV